MSMLIKSVFIPLFFLYAVGMRTETVPPFIVSAVSHSFIRVNDATVSQVPRGRGVCILVRTKGWHFIFAKMRSSPHNSSASRRTAATASSLHITKWLSTCSAGQGLLTKQICCPRSKSWLSGTDRKRRITANPVRTVDSRCCEEFLMWVSNLERSARTASAWVLQVGGGGGGATPNKKLH
jgi:hypothetical protein